LRALIREPLVHFLALGLAIFAAAHLVAATREDSKRRIVVDAALERRLSALQVLQTGAPPSAAELAALTNDYVRDEALYRTALKMGLDRGDEIVRRRMIQKLEFLLEDQGGVGKPDEATLKRFYADHVSQFVRPGKVSFKHVYFDPALGGDAAAFVRARDAAKRQGTPAGDPFALQPAYTDLDRTAALQVFGQTPIIDALFARPAHQWIGPVRSGYGWHLVFIDVRKPDITPRFDEIRGDVRAAWLAQAREAARQARLSRLEAGFQVVHAESRAPH